MPSVVVSERVVPDLGQLLGRADLRLDGWQASAAEQTPERASSSFSATPMPLRSRRMTRLSLRSSVAETTGAAVLASVAGSGCIHRGFGCRGVAVRRNHWPTMARLDCSVQHDAKTGFLRLRRRPRSGTTRSSPPPMALLWALPGARLSVAPGSFELARGSRLLATSTGAYPNQAFAYGSGIGVQFHPRSPTPRCTAGPATPTRASA